jgi:hypothetical protein
MARNARAERAVTRFNFTGLNHNTIESTGNGQLSQQDPVDPQIVQQSGVAAHPEPKESSEPERESNRKKPYETRADSDEPVAPGLSIGEFTVPPPPEALHPR